MRNPIIEVRVSMQLQPVAVDETSEERIAREGAQVRLDRISAELAKQLRVAFTTARNGEPFDVSVRIRL